MRSLHWITDQVMSTQWTLMHWWFFILHLTQECKSCVITESTVTLSIVITTVASFNFHLCFFYFSFHSLLPPQVERFSMFESSFALWITIWRVDEDTWEFCASVDRSEETCEWEYRTPITLALGKQVAWKRNERWSWRCGKKKERRRRKL